MIIYAAFLYIILSSIYTFSFSAKSWKDDNKLASIGAVMLVFISMAAALFILYRT